MAGRPQGQLAAQQLQHCGVPSTTESARRSELEVVRIGLLGGFRLSVGPRLIEEDRWRLRKAKSLLKLLALAPGHRLHREQVMETLWPDLGMRRASNNLHQILHAVRRTLEPAALATAPASGSAASASSGYLLLRDEQLNLCPDSPLWVDVEAFEQTAATARQAMEPQAFRAAIDLYAGELLPEDRYEGWVEERRAQLRELYLSLLLELGALLEGRGDFGEAIEALGRVVAEEPTHEGAHVGLMRLHALSGRRREALGQYERLREALLKEFGTEPDAASTSLQQEIWAGTFPHYSDSLPAGLPAREEEARFAARAPRRRHNLPLKRTSFVGRERECLEVKRHLAMTRLLTLTGTGGCGKTRLGLEVARDLVGVYPDGVWLVELAPLSDPTLTAQPVAQALEVPERPAQPLAETLAEILRGRELLLILDNCEHLLEATARLVDLLLDSCPHLRIMATSREALAVEGEVRWPVAPLSVPEQERTSSSQELEGYESTRLFVQRAKGRDPTFSLSPQDALAVAEICRKLGGIPLAIELAAARVGTLSLEHISERLEGSLDLLSGGARTAVSRQRTLRGTLDWSHELLSDPERKIFRKLSVFAGGWTLEAAEAVASGEDIEETEILDLLSGLVEKSLVVAEPTEQGGVRYRLLEPVRQYALEKLEQSGEAEDVKCSHAGYFLALAEEAEPWLSGPREAEWFERLEAELDNIRAAHSWARAHGEAELSLRLAGALGGFWYWGGHYGEARGWLEAALAQEARTSALVRAKALAAVSSMAWAQGDLGKLKEAAEEGLRLSKEAGIEGDRTTFFLGGTYRAVFLNLLITAFTEARDNERTVKLGQESLRLNRQAGDVQGIAWSLLNLANASADSGDPEQAEEFYAEGLSLARELDSGYNCFLFLLNWGWTVLIQGDHQRATRLTGEALELARERGRGFLGLLPRALDTLPWLTLLGGEPQRAKAKFEENLTLSKELGDKATIKTSLDGLACVAGANGEALRAAKLFGAAEALILIEATGFGLSPLESAMLEPYRASARSRLGEAGWDEALAVGRTMSMEAAIAYAISESEEGPSTTTQSTTSEQPLSSTRDHPAKLTPREIEVLGLVAVGMTNAQVANEIFVSPRTVETHLTSIYHKLGVSSRAAATRFALEHNPELLELKG
jgi:predicted ATPase/DNA-binding SARP family transcriptional activator/DNA-binding CsgD family transcriptional regulator